MRLLLAAIIALAAPHHAKTVLAVNKVDDPRTAGELPLGEFHALGFGEVVPVSAEHGRGVGELADHRFAGHRDR